MIHYYLDETAPLYALLAYAKNAKDDMAPDEKRMVATLAATLATRGGFDRPSPPGRHPLRMIATSGQAGRL